VAKLRNRVEVELEWPGPGLIGNAPPINAPQEQAPRGKGFIAAVHVTPVEMLMSDISMASVRFQHNQVKAGLKGNELFVIFTGQRDTVKTLIIAGWTSRLNI